MMGSGRYFELSRNDIQGGHVHNDDSKGHRWRRIGLSLLPLIPIIWILSLLLGLCLAGIKFSHTEKDYGCSPSGAVWVTQANRPNLWGGSYGLAVTIGFGEFPFSTAKAIDVLWDLVVGRGMQVLIAVVIYYVFRGSITNAIQHYPVSYTKILRMEYNTTGFSSLATYARDIHWKRRSARQFFSALTLTLATVYALIAPTWISAMTGYQATAIPLIMLQNGIYVSFSDIANCDWVVQDGDRVGLDQNACVQQGTNLATSLQNYLQNYVTYNYTQWTANAANVNANISSTFTSPNGQERHLAAPLLNITRNSFENSNNAVFYQGRSLTDSFLMEHGMCAPQETYRWGFSLILLFLFLTTTFFTSLLLYGIWLHSYWRKTEVDNEHVFGSLRAAVTVASSIRNELGSQTEELSNRELRKATSARQTGVRLRKRDDVKLLRLGSEAAVAKIHDSRPTSSRNSSSHGRSVSENSVP
ncbi:hypothetical protein LTR86_008883 [Recurvomyces mirabilis]|nr:hypothetical protein LTR86_008883 [Recurvomyces mirabilis]